MPSASTLTGKDLQTSGTSHSLLRENGAGRRQKEFRTHPVRITKTIKRNSINFIRTAPKCDNEFVISDIMWKWTSSFVIFSRSRCCQKCLPVCARTYKRLTE